MIHWANSTATRAHIVSCTHSLHTRARSCAASGVGDHMSPTLATFMESRRLYIVPLGSSDSEVLLRSTLYTKRKKDSLPIFFIKYLLYTEMGNYIPFKPASIRPARGAAADSLLACVQHSLRCCFPLLSYRAAAESRPSFSPRADCCRLAARRTVIDRRATDAAAAPPSENPKKLFMMLGVKVVK